MKKRTRILLKSKIGIRIILFSLAFLICFSGSNSLAMPMNLNTSQFQTRLVFKKASDTVQIDDTNYKLEFTYISPRNGTEDDVHLSFVNENDNTSASITYILTGLINTENECTINIDIKSLGLKDGTYYIYWFVYMPKREGFRPLRNEGYGMTLTVVDPNKPDSQWVEKDGAWFYLDSNGVKKTGWQKIDDFWYYFNADGEMATGWIEYGDTWYYMQSNGAMATGWIKDGSDWYYMQSNGAMATGWVESGKDWYYMNNNGAMATGWVEFGKDWYYMRPTGIMANGWVWDGAWYYFNDSGRMVTGWVEDDGIWYYFTSSGAMKTGWLELGNRWYWFDGSGAMATGWKEISGQWEMFADSGEWLYTWQGN